MSVPQLGDHRDRVQAGVLGEGGGDDFEGLGVGGEAVSLHAGEAGRVLGEQARDVDLGRTATGDEGALLDEAAHDAERVVETALRLLDDERVGAGAEHADRLAARVLDPADADDLGPVARDLLDKVRLAELVGRHLLDVRDGLAPERAREELDLVALDVAHGEDLELLEVRERELVRRVAEDRLLDEQDVAAR